MKRLFMCALIEAICRAVKVREEKRSSISQRDSLRFIYFAEYLLEEKTINLQAKLEK